MTTPSAAAVPSLGPFMRYVTGHDPVTAKAIHIRSSQVATEPMPGSKLNDKMKVLFTTTRVPAEDNSVTNAEWIDPMEEGATSLANGSGTVLRVVDFPPNEGGMQHRTSSIDYGIVLYGQIVHTLDSGERVTLNAGDIMVQRGTMHGWDNETDDWARMLFVLTAAKPAVINGQTLEQGGFKSSDVATPRPRGK